MGLSQADSVFLSLKHAETSRMARHTGRIPAMVGGEMVLGVSPCSTS